MCRLWNVEWNYGAIFRRDCHLWKNGSQYHSKFNLGLSKLNFRFAEILLFFKIFFSQVESETQVESSLYFGSEIKVESSLYFGSEIEVETCLYSGSAMEVESSLYFGSGIQVGSNM